MGTRQATQPDFSIQKTANVVSGCISSVCLFVCLFNFSGFRFEHCPTRMILTWSNVLDSSHVVRVHHRHPLPQTRPRSPPPNQADRLLYQADTNDPSTNNYKFNHVPVSSVQHKWYILTDLYPNVRRRQGPRWWPVPKRSTQTLACVLHTRLTVRAL